MPTVRTKIDDATYAKLVKMRKTAGLPSVSALLLKNCGVLTDELKASEIVRKAIPLAQSKPPKSDYRLSDLFKRDMWEKFDKKARVRAGRLFAEEVASGRLGIIPTKKSTQNHQFYRTGAEK